ncbi:hypothetical protein [Polymorphospora lycopeni]|uniref:Uncharacterized protein n=1 Tax=Polymorphospora lycopeni TaxID=3140240 RepID=A0ABV5CQJ1_9ACTN
MNASVPRGRKAVARLLFGAALAALMAVSTGGAATAGTTVDAGPGSGSTVSSRTDAYLKDTSSDVGFEPHGAILSSFFNSPDVKVCPNTSPGCVHSNPVVGSTSYIHANLRANGPYGAGVSFGTLKAYYTTSGGGANWPGDWTPIGSRTIAVAPGGVTSTFITWPNVPSLGHFCILLRWESETDPMLFEGPATSINTQYNNNIVWKNADTVSVGGGGIIVDRPFAVANALNVAAPFDIAVRPLAEPVPGLRLVADLGPELFARWQRGGQQGEGIRVVGRTQIEFADPQRAAIKGILINPGERPVLKLSFSAAQPLQKSYGLQITQVGPLREPGESFVVGGVDYTIEPGRPQA